MSKRVTVLMPVYNGADFLSETIDSVLAQTYRNFDFLIINDGSTDRTEEIILSYADNRIIYVKNEMNLGLVTTLNKGIELTTTEFLARMDADDLWHETKLEKQIRLLDARPDVGICGTSIRKFGAFEANFIFPVDNIGLKVGFLFYCCMSHPSVVFRTSFLASSGIRYRQDYYPAEDYKMWVESMQQTQIYNIPEILVYYRQHMTQITHAGNKKQLEQTNRMRIEALGDIAQQLSSEEKEFHINIFLKADTSEFSDYTQFKNWVKKLLILNSLNNYPLHPKLLSNALNKHIQSRYIVYLKDKYFVKHNLVHILIFLISGKWVNLNIALNLKLFLNKV